MNKFKIQVVFAGAKTVTVTDTFEGVVEMVLTSETLSKYQAIKMVFPGTGKVLYFDIDLFRLFHQGGLHYSDLVQQTECDNVYRNWLALEHGADVIEPGALWVAQGDTLTLIDKDRHLTFTLPNEAFEVV